MKTSVDNCDQGGKLTENWVFIDILHFLNIQGLDVLKRMKELSEPWLDPR